MDCIFCKIIEGEIPSKAVYNDELVFAFYDVSPKAPVHILIVPKKHIVSVNDFTVDDNALLAHIFDVAKQIAKRKGISESGYRLIFNTGKDAGQTVFHAHLHILGGDTLCDLG
ncbi:MAG: histidine triad nucleotide-binding protein [Clostridiales bacterium]|nr:histidine triad nucleotide-binding protein [Clostridiales bacterium]